jgi:hypothetical protein
MTNTSTHDINASASYDKGLNFSYAYHVRRKGGTVLQPKQSDSPISGTSKIRNLRASESVEEVTNLSDEYNMAEPGKYVIQLSRAASGDPKDGIVKSNTITVTVVP